MWSSDKTAWIYRLDYFQILYKISLLADQSYYILIAPINRFFLRQKIRFYEYFSVGCPMEEEIRYKKKKHENFRFDPEMNGRRKGAQKIFAIFRQIFIDHRVARYFSKRVLYSEGRTVISNSYFKFSAHDFVTNLWKVKHRKKKKHDALHWFVWSH